MKILCVSDQIDPLIYNQNARKNFHDIDMVLCAGDLPMDYVDFIVSVFNVPAYFVFGNHNLTELKYYHGFQKTSQPHTQHTQRNLSGFTAMAEEDAKNHNHGATYAGFKVLSNHGLPLRMHKNGRKTPLLIAGASGSIKYNNGQCQYTDRQMKAKLICMIPKLLLNKILYGRYLDIFLTHATPLSIHDKEDQCHKGFKCYNWFLKKFKPSYMVHGHIHLYDQRDERSGKYYDTTVVNAFAHCVIYLPYLIDENNPDIVKIET